DNFLYKNQHNLDDSNVSFLYDKSLLYVDFGSKYDIRVHSVQTALVYMGYMYNVLSFSELKYGYYCVCTFDMVKAFQKENGIIPTGRLCEKTWNLIFKKLYSNYNVIILKNNEKEICIKDMQEENQYKSDCNLKAINSFIYDELECDYNLIDSLIDDYNYKENKLKYDLENSDYQPSFNPNNINTLRKNNFSISLIYGDKKEKYRKIIGVLPVSVSQEIDTTGNPIYDIYEFIAKDVIEINN
ncbi:peptidoglycan-binding domain-containing protein, partial [Clostridioides difficile]|uniref:peptidoglycan-binding domain-containing protein n=1 Tax=Clostridioides difficile TaxID=1496 RepID=UPI003F8D39FD